MKELARITFPDKSYISLTLENGWQSSGKDCLAVPFAKLANPLSRPPFYEYSPSHGCYGPLLASKVQERIGGELTLPKVEQSKPNPDVVF